MTRVALPLKPRPSKPERMSYEDFLERYSGGEHVEWVDGEVVEMSAVWSPPPLLVVLKEWGIVQ